MGSNPDSRSESKGQRGARGFKKAGRDGKREGELLGKGVIEEEGRKMKTTGKEGERGIGRDAETKASLPEPGWG